MEGFNDDWVQADLRQAIYTQLPAGKYTFRVRASDLYGQWLEEEIALAIRVYPHWYETLAFRAVQ